MAEEKEPFDVVLEAYADAYPGGLKLPLIAADIKFYPSYPNEENRILQEFIGANEGQITDLRKPTSILKNMGRTNAFTKKGFFTKDIVKDFVVDDNEKKTMSIYFKKVTEIEGEGQRNFMFQRLLTIIYGKPHDTVTKFFNPVAHIEKAASLKDTVDIMIMLKNSVVERAGSA